MSEKTDLGWLGIVDKLLKVSFYPLRGWFLNRQCVKDILIGLNNAQEILLRDEIIKTLKESIHVKDFCLKTTLQDVELIKDRAKCLENEKAQIHELATTTLEEKDRIIQRLYDVCDQQSSLLDKYTVLEDMVGHFAASGENISYAMLIAIRKVVFNQLPNDAVSNIAKNIRESKTPVRQLAALRLLALEKHPDEKNTD